MPAPQQFEELTLDKLETFLLRFADERRTGQLKIQGEGAKGGRVDLREGKIVAVDSPFASEALGEIARKLGFLNKGDVQKAIDALSRADNAGRQLGDILVSENLITRNALETCLRYQAESALHSMIGFHGRISFLPGNVAPAEITLDPREVFDRIKQRDHVEEVGSAVLGLIDQTPAAGMAAVDALPVLPEYEAQEEVRRIAQAAIREAAQSATAVQADLDAQASAAAAELMRDGTEPHVPLPDLPDAELVPLEKSFGDSPLRAADDRPRLGRVILDVCRPGASSTEALLAYASHFARRAVLFAAASKGLRIAGCKTQDGHSFATKLDGIVLPRETGTGAIGRVMSERVPARGPFEWKDDADTKLTEALGPAPDGDAIMFPIALHERAIGLLYADGVPPGDPAFLEGLAAAVAVTAVVMENKLAFREKEDAAKK